MVGKPSSGKSTFFKSATLAEAEIANYPFTTIKPNHGTGYVQIPDIAKEFGKKANPREGYVIDDIRFVPVDMMDIAGLVPGAHEGLGMGSQFLDDIRQADALVHVIDISGSVNEKGEPCGLGNYDPLNDVEFLEVELDYWYKGILEKGWDRFARTVKQSKESIVKAIAKQVSAFKVTEDMVNDAVHKLKLSEEDPTTWQDSDLLHLAKELRLKTKPMVLACNKIDTGAVAIKNFERLKEKYGQTHIVIHASSECELVLRSAAKAGIIKYIPGHNNFEILTPDKLSDKQKLALDFIKKNVLDVHGSTGVQECLNIAVFKLLGYIAIHPGGTKKLEDSHGNVIPDCFLMPKGTTALDFAFRLHTDFGTHFVKAIDVRTKMPIGRDTPLKDLDIVEIMSNK